MRVIIQRSSLETDIALDRGVSFRRNDRILDFFRFFSRSVYASTRSLFVQLFERYHLTSMDRIRAKQSDAHRAFAACESERWERIDGRGRPQR
jgi:hypothetical protein